MKKHPRVQRVWRRIEAELQAYPVDSQREFFAAACKFLINPANWDDPHPRTRYDQHPEIASYHRGFVQYSRVQMSGAKSAPLTDAEKAVLKLLKKAAGWRGHAVDRITAIKKLRMLRDRMHKRFSDLRSGQDFTALENAAPRQDPLKGLRVYESVITKTYLLEQDQQPAAANTPPTRLPQAEVGSQPQTNV